jgi:hypothetical protein
MLRSAMKKADRTLTLRQHLIIVFCLLHMFAVTAFLMPRKMAVVQPIIRPYIQMLSQWQSWDIFSPDPLRRASFFRLETETDDMPETVALLDAAHLPWYERAKELKVLGRLYDDWGVLAADYVRSMCLRYPQAAGEVMRLVASSTVIPSDLPHLAVLASWNPPFEERTVATIRCPFAATE